jgi:hypothetical protein
MDVLLEGWFGCGLRFDAREFQPAAASSRRRRASVRRAQRKLLVISVKLQHGSPASFCRPE